MTTASARLQPTAELARALAAVAERGAVCIRSAVSRAACERLRLEVEAGPFRIQPETVGPVRQRLETLELRDRLAGFPAVAELRDELAATVAEHAAADSPLRRWRPDDVSVQRYRPAGDVGITPHLDGKRYRLLVAVLTIAGRARFSLHAERAGEPIRSWTLVPGTLVLLRGPGLTGPDERPFHSVSGPLGDGLRYSIGFRMDSRRATT